MASTSEELSGQADGLMSTINFFDIGDAASETRVSRAAADPRPPQRPTAAKSPLKTEPKPAGPARHAAPAAAGKKNGKTNGFTLNLAARHDKVDEDFERY
jgi:hypothetical protein